MIDKGPDRSQQKSGGLATVRKSGGTISVLRALASQGVHESKAGEAVAEGRVMLERGWLPQHRVCHGCGALIGDAAAGNVRVWRLTGTSRPSSSASSSWASPAPKQGGIAELAALAGDRLRRILKATTRRWLAHKPD